MSRTRCLLAVGLALLGAVPLWSGAREPARRQPPNLVVEASAALIDAAARRPVVRTQPVADCIRGTPISGLTQAVGEAHAELVPDPCRASVDVIVTATSYARNVGKRPHFLVYTSGIIPFETRQRIVIDGRGIGAYPPCTRACARVNLQGLTNCEGECADALLGPARLGFSCHAKEIEAETAEHAAARISAEMEGEVGPELVKANQAVAGGLRRLRGLGFTLEGLHFDTTAERLRLAARFATPGLEEPGPAPPAPAGADLGVRVHESLLNEAARLLLGGKTLGLGDALKLARELAGPLLRDGRPEADQHDGLRRVENLIEKLGDRLASATLAERDPVMVAFAEDEIAVEIHIARVTLAGQPLPGMRARAVYHLEQRPGELRLVRRGRLTFLTPDRQEDSAAKPAGPGPLVRPVLEAVFGEILKERFVLKDITPAGQLDKIGPLTIAGARARDGWLVLGWALKQPAADCLPE